LSAHNPNKVKAIIPSVQQHTAPCSTACDELSRVGGDAPASLCSNGGRWGRVGGFPFFCFQGVLKCDTQPKALIKYQYFTNVPLIFFAVLSSSGMKSTKLQYPNNKQ
jgi:hypothetical protein